MTKARFDSVQKLIAFFEQYDDQLKGTSADIKSSLYRRYLEQPFAQLKDQLEKEGIDPIEQEKILLRVEEMELNLRSGIVDLESKNEELADTGETMLSVILDAFFQMEDLKDESDVYILARKVANDSSYPDATRSRAILLVAKLGTKNDFETLYIFLNDDSERVKRSTIGAIGLLHRKITGESLLPNLYTSFCDSPMGC
jgi:hypothetical protein